MTKKTCVTIGNCRVTEKSMEATAVEKLAPH